MNQDHRKCCYCGSFNAYYTRGYCCLLKENNGYCSRHKKIMDKNECCDQWYHRRTSKKRRIRAVVNAIPEIYQKIAVIEQMLNDDEELQKIID